MGIEDVGGTLGVVLTALVAGGAGYKVLEKILDLWSTSDARTSQSWREYAEKLEVRLEQTEGELDALRHELDAERRTRASQEDDCRKRMNDIWRHVSKLERIIRDSGMLVPGEDTPAGGIAAGKAAQAKGLTS